MFQTQKQIRLSNKHQLFERRLDKYILIKELLSLYSQHRHLVIDPNIYKMVDYQFSWLTNSSTLEIMNCAMSSPRNEKCQKIFLTKYEMLEKSAVEITLLWDGSIADVMSKFVRQYKDLLQAMYKQQIIISELQEQNKETPILADIFEEKTKASAEHINLASTIEAIEATYNEIIRKKAEQKLAASIKF